jgi:uncharacterized protein YjbJ (UPF0337 family)
VSPHPGGVAQPRHAERAAVALGRKQSPRILMVGLTLPALEFREDSAAATLGATIQPHGVFNEDVFMNKDQIKGRVDEATGKTKEVIGKIAQDESLKQKGRAQEVAGKARATYGDAKDEIGKDNKKAE